MIAIRNTIAMNRAFTFYITLLMCFQSGWSQSPVDRSEFKDYRGFIDFYYDDKSDKIYLEIGKLDTELLYVYSLSSGIGSNDIGLDRGQLGSEQVIYFTKAGNKILLIQPNMRYRAQTANKLERESVEQAFARSVLWGFPIKDRKNGKFLIDATDFLMQDVHGVAGRLKQAKQGSYSLDKTKSAFNLKRTKAFPENIEIDVMLTFKGNPEGTFIRSVAPNPHLVTVTEHHSFVKLPDDKFKKRIFDPRSGAYPLTYYDYATPVQQPIKKRFITRHRLQKKNPEAKISEAVEPIIYYLDNGTPEPIRSALLEGGRWWNQAFEAIGFKDAFQLKILPDHADPMDIRYNVIQWVHRSTRGWSYGGSIIDPRTGEILKGHVSLGSLRIRQDFMITQALMNKPFAENDNNYEAMLALALARIRQLSAHEIGHTLGFAHNFAASANNRASVMDYPHPQLDIVNGDIDFSKAYATGIGDWDKVTVAYSYGIVPQGKSELEFLNEILELSQKRGLRYISDADARPLGGAHISAHLWDNGENAIEELNRVLAIRAQAISNFSIDNIRTDEPLSVLEDTFVPLYFFHRYQTEATAKLVGGLDYNYAVKGDGQLIVKSIHEKTQRAAFEALLRTLRSETLAIPREKLTLFPPRAMGYPRDRESFKGKTGVAFDALNASSTASTMTLKLLLHPERLSRLVQQKALNANQFGPEELLRGLLNRTIKDIPNDSYQAEVQRTINYSVLYELFDVGVNSNSSSQVRALVISELMRLKNWLEEHKTNPTHRMLAFEIERFLKEPSQFKKPKVPKIPDGSPIGMDCLETINHGN